MSLFKRKASWRVANVHVLMDGTAMQQFAFNTACRLLDDGLVSKIYFASYSHVGETYVEFKLVPLVEDNTLDIFLRELGGAEVHTIQITPFEGSDAHAEAFRLARLLKGMGDENIQDVIHWCFNMAGFSYTQEIRLHSLSAAQIATTLMHVERGL